MTNTTKHPAPWTTDSAGCCAYDANGTAVPLVTAAVTTRVIRDVNHVAELEAENAALKQRAVALEGTIRSYRDGAQAAEPTHDPGPYAEGQRAEVMWECRYNAMARLWVRDEAFIPVRVVPVKAPPTTAERLADLIGPALRAVVGQAAWTDEVPALAQFLADRGVTVDPA